jgi:hypothetical protein
MLNQKPSLMWSQKKLSVVLSQKKLSLMFENTMTLIPVEWDGELDCNAEISKQLQQHFFAGTPTTLQMKEIGIIHLGLRYSSITLSLLFMHYSSCCYKKFMPSFSVTWVQLFLRNWNQTSANNQQHYKDVSHVGVNDFAFSE